MATGLTGAAHVNVGKAARCRANLARFKPTVGGMTGSTRVSVVGPVALCIFTIWADMARQNIYTKQVDMAIDRNTPLSSQPTLAVRVAKTYTAVSTNVFLVLTLIIFRNFVANERV